MTKVPQVFAMLPGKPVSFRCFRGLKHVTVESHNGGEGLQSSYYEHDWEYDCLPEIGWRVSSRLMRENKMEYICTGEDAALLLS